MVLSSKLSLTWFLSKSDREEFQETSLGTGPINVVVIIKIIRINSWKSWLTSYL